MGARCGLAAMRSGRVAWVLVAEGARYGRAPRWCALEEFGSGAVRAECAVADMVWSGGCGGSAVECVCARSDCRVGLVWVCGASR